MQSANDDAPPLTKEETKALYDFFQEQIAAENDLLNRRVNWFLLFEGLFVIIWGIVLVQRDS